ncbi:MAG: hypothetical protein CL933_12645 [Deltaproteobacteria bacterium]|nr:hypothetical protein [Deltaproteobacteria bacterium]
MAIFLHEGDPLAADRVEKLELGARSHAEDLVEEERPANPGGGNLFGRGAARDAADQTVEAAAAPGRRLVPPLAVEGLAALQVHAIDVAGPPLPAARADVPDVDHLRPAAAARRTHVERTLQTEHLRHA